MYNIFPDSEKNKPSSAMMQTLKELLYFQTLQIVTVQSIRLGSLHRLFQVAVIFYIFLYSIWYAKGYQDHTTASGVLFTKVKGSAIYIGSNGTIDVFDSNDLVIPPVESDALFIMTSYVETTQKKGICTSNVDVCRSNADCPAQTLTSLGSIVPICNISQGAQSGFCLLQTWCPLENDSIVETLQGVENMTVFLRTSANYNKFNIQLADSPNAILGVNTFMVKDMLAGGNIQTDCSAGCIIVAGIDWTCNLDILGCSPTHSYQKVPGGFNFRQVDYFYEEENGTLVEYRQLEKLFGVRFLFGITGNGGKFSFFQMIVTIGSGLAFLSVATLLVDLFMLAIYSSDDVFQQNKYINYKVDEKTDLEASKGGEDVEID